MEIFYCFQEAHCNSGFGNIVVPAASYGGSSTVSNSIYFQFASLFPLQAVMNALAVFGSQKDS